METGHLCVCEKRDWEKLAQKSTLPHCYPRMTPTSPVLRNAGVIWAGVMLVGPNRSGGGGRPPASFNVANDLERRRLGPTSRYLCASVADRGGGDSRMLLYLLASSVRPLILACSLSQVAAAAVVRSTTLRFTTAAHRLF